MSLLGAKLIAEAHGGRIEIGNHQDGGAVVRLYFQSVPCSHSPGDEKYEFFQ